MYAVFKTGGKQYRVAADEKLQIERLVGDVGDIITFGEVLMIGNGEEFDLGLPLVAGASVAAEIVSHDRGKKIIIFKKRRRKHYRRRNGHRQDHTTVRITEILVKGAKASPKSQDSKASDAPHPETAPAAGNL